jgi:hypothetical protein
MASPGRDTVRRPCHNVSVHIITILLDAEGVVYIKKWAKKWAVVRRTPAEEVRVPLLYSGVNRGEEPVLPPDEPGRIGALRRCHCSGQTFAPPTRGRRGRGREAELRERTFQNGVSERGGGVSERGGNATDVPPGRRDLLATPREPVPSFLRLSPKTDAGGRRGCERPPKWSARRRGSSGPRG